MLKRNIHQSKPKVLLALCLTFCLFIINSCKKDDLFQNKEIKEINPVSLQIIQNFLNFNKNSEPIILRIGEEIQKRNVVTDFIPNFAATNGYPVWDKYLVCSASLMRLSPKALGGPNNISLPQNGDTLIYIPIVLANTQKVNGFIRAVLNDSIALSFCLAQDSKNYPVSGASVITANQFTSFMMVLDYEVFGHTYFNITDTTLFKSVGVANNSASRLFKLSSIAMNNVNSLLAGTVTSVCWVSPSESSSAGTCSCGPGGCWHWAAGTDDCSVISCIDFGAGSSSGPPPMGGGYPTTGGGAPSGGGGYIPPYYPCTSGPTQSSLWPEPLPPCPPPPPALSWEPSMAIIAESPTTVIEYNSGPNIDLDKYKNCFALVSSIGATYTIKLCADIPVNSNPNQVNTLSSAGHVFITMTKTNGAQSIIQNFGFYPRNGSVSLLGLPVSSKVVDDQLHEYDASISMNINESSFLSIFSAAQIYTAPSYDLNDYNCANVGLAIFNSVRSNSFTIPNTYSTIGAYFGKTPIGLYQTLQYKKTHNDPEANNIQIGTDTSPLSHGPCN